MTSARLVVDASVAVKWVLPETETPQANALLASTVALHAPEHIRVETASAVTRAFRMGRLNRADAEDALKRAYDTLTGSAFALWSDASLLPRAECLALDLGHPLKDCLYLALAERERCELVTTDQTLIGRAAPHFPFVRAL